MLVMPNAIYIDDAGLSCEITVPVGTSLMRAAVDIGLNGIVGMCGGNLSCATCHVFIAADFTNRLPAPTLEEEQMLDCTAAPRRENSRLSCQIVMNEALDGIVVQMADPQT
jgi:2Fe-2S ferredoxin